MSATVLHALNRFNLFTPPPTALGGRCYFIIIPVLKITKQRSQELRNCLLSMQSELLHHAVLEGHTVDDNTALYMVYCR